MAEQLVSLLTQGQNKQQLYLFMMDMHFNKVVLLTYIYTDRTGQTDRHC
jgi:hypothetical protein